MLFKVRIGMMLDKWYLIGFIWFNFQVSLFSAFVNITLNIPTLYSLESWLSGTFETVYYIVEWFQRKRRDFNSISNSDKTLAQTIKLNLVNILFKNILNKMMRKAKICKIPIQKWPNYIINTKLKVGIIFIKLWELAFNYKAKMIYKS